MAFRFETLCDGEGPKSSPSGASHKDTGPAIDRRGRPPYETKLNSTRCHAPAGHGDGARSAELHDP
jgi:hypothetical protein